MQDGPTVRLGFALMAPVVPLLVILSCLVLEFFSTGSGIAAMLKAWNFSDFFLMKSRYSGKDCSTEQETCPSDFFKIFVRVGEKQRICGWPTKLKLKRISSLFNSNLEAAGHYHLVHWWGVWHIIFTDLPRSRRKPRCFCYILVQFDIFLPVLGFVWPPGFVFPVSFSCPFAKKCMKECYVRRLTFYKVQKQPAPIQCVLWNCGSFWMYFLSLSLYIISCRFESPFWMPRCYPKFPISGSPSGRLHLPISHTCHPVHGAHEHEDLGGYFWLCLRVWLRCRDSYLHALPLLSPARSATFQPNDQRGICHLWRWYQSFLAWSPRFHHGENFATGQGCFCLSDCCILLIYCTCAMVG